jgi:NAD-dependent dihydropyrimidine dehydrogenase PreA subunit
MLEQISFDEIKSLFDPSEWDVGVLTPVQLKQVANLPVKHKFHVVGKDFTNRFRFRGDLPYTIVLIKTGHTWDYSHYDNAIQILTDSGLTGWSPLYTNFKEAAIFSGLGVRGRNSLIYSYKFGFDCHIVCIAFDKEIIDIPTNTRVNYKLWTKCRNCYDCINACPANAIHGKKEPYWLDGEACENFIFYSDHDRVPSVKKFWHEKIHPEIPKEIIDQVKDRRTAKQFLNDMEFDANGYHHDGQVTRKDGEIVYVYHCRECTSQPRCSKWGGKYPYEKLNEAT